MLVIALRIPYTDGLEPNGKIKARYKVLKVKPVPRDPKVLKVKPVPRDPKVLKVLEVLKENLEISPFN